MLGASSWYHMIIPEQSEVGNSCSKIYSYNVYAQVPQPGNPPEPIFVYDKVSQRQLPRNYIPINPNAKVPGDPNLPDL